MALVSTTNHKPHVNINTNLNQPKIKGFCLATLQGSASFFL